MATPQVFAANMLKRAAQVREGTSLGVQKVMLDIDKEVVLATPRDTGRASNNWIPSLESPAAGERPGVGPKGRYLAADAALISRFGPKNTSIWLSNNVPYIGALEGGHSKRKQAPNGMVQKAVARGIRSLASIRLLRP